MMSAAELQSRIKGKKSLVVLAARAGHFKEVYGEIPRDLCKCSCTLFILRRCQPLHLLCKEHPHPSHLCWGENLSICLITRIILAISTQLVLSVSSADGYSPPSEINSNSFCRPCAKRGFIYSVLGAGYSQVCCSPSPSPRAVLRSFVAQVRN